MDVRAVARVAAVACLLLAAGCSSRVPPAGTLRLAVINLGEAESILLQTSESAVLIDSGETDCGYQVARFLKDHGVSKIDLAVLTHAHSDHMGGLPSAASQIPVKQVLVPDPVEPSVAYENLINWASESRVQIRRARRGQVIRMPGVALEVLWPPDGGPGLTCPGENNNSVVLKARHGKIHLLLTGDIQSETEAELVRAGTNLRADLLKVAHQGSDTSSSEEFLARVKPKVAVISVGKANGYGHPSQQVLGRLQSCGARVYSTADDGDLVFESDGSRIRRAL